MGDHSHSHGHSHSHASAGGWAEWRHEPALRAVLVLVAGALVVTLIGLAALWPDSGGRTAAEANAADLGLTTSRVRADVIRVVEQECSYATPDQPEQCVEFSFEVQSGDAAGLEVTLPELNPILNLNTPDLSVGDRVVLGYDATTDFYFFADLERRRPLVILTLVFAAVVVALGRFRGLLALAGMATTLVVLIGFVAPSVLDGNDPVIVSVVAASVIAFVSLYLTHGFSPTTTVALAGTLMALGLTLGLALLSFWVMGFTGLATEEALILPLIATDLNVSALLLGGAIIGALGALDDVTVTQVATVAEIQHRNPDLSRAELVTSGIKVGREHIASTVNTLLLAYAGASMPLLLLFAVSTQSLSSVANSELIAIEIVRTLCGSIGLVAAVPITTTLAAVVTAGRSADPDRAAEAAADPGSQPEAAVTAEEPTPVTDTSVHYEEPTWDDFSPDDKP